MFDVQGLLWTVLDPLVDPAGRTFVGSLVVAAGVAIGLRAHARRESPWRAAVEGSRALGRLLVHRSSRLDAQLLLGRQLLRAAGLLPALAGAWWISTHAVRWLDATLGRPELGLPALASSIAYTVVLFIAWDLSRYVLHRLMHELPALWSIHQVHHSAEVLTPLTLHRIHPLESLLYAVRGWLVTTAVVIGFAWLFRDGVTEVTFLGAHILGFALNAFSGNLRHSHVWWRFGPAVERWLISPAQHQVHHAADPALQQTNYGTWLAVWDRLGGSLHVAGELPPTAFGLDAAERNHGDDLLSAWLGPLRGLLPTTLRPAAAALGLVALLPTPALGEEPARDEDTDTDETGAAPGGFDEDDEIIVTSERGVPEVAGSAHQVDEETLQRFEYDDIHRVLATVPGVYVRGEDGFGLRPNIGIRGASSERSAKVTLLEDGIPLAPAPYAAPAAYFFPNTTRLVGVEVFKGPSATQHGPYTIGGAINLRTRPVPTEGPTVGVDLAGGLYESGKAHLYAGTGDERGGVLLEGLHLGTHGFQQLPDGSSTGFQRTELMAKSKLVLSTGHIGQKLELKLGFAREISHASYLGIHESDAEENPWQRYATTRDGLMQWWRTQGELAWSLRVGNRLQIRTVAYRHDLERSWTKLARFADGTELHEVTTGPADGSNAIYLALLRGEEDTLDPSQRLMVGTNARRFATTGVQSRARFQLPGDRIRTRGEIGVRLHHDSAPRQHTEVAHDVLDGELVDVGEGTVTTQDRVLVATALAAHTHWVVDTGTFQFEPGLRVEAVETWVDDATTGPSKKQQRVTPLPGLGVLMRAGPEVDVFAGVYRGFSPVGPGQSEDTVPETAWNAELGTRIGSATRGMDTTAFVSDYQNISGVCTFSSGCLDDDIDRQFNGGKALVAGVEASVHDDLALRPGLSLPMSAAYTFTHSAFQTRFTSGFPQFGNVEVGDRLPYLPLHQGRLTVGLAHERFHAHVGTEWRSGQYDSAAAPDQDVDIPAMALVDAAVHVRAVDALWVYATGTNLLDTPAGVSLRPAGWRPVARRQVMLGVKWGR